MIISSYNKNDTIYIFVFLHKLYLQICNYLYVYFERTAFRLSANNRSSLKRANFFPGFYLEEKKLQYDQIFLNDISCRTKR